MQLTSPVFGDNQLIPVRYTCEGPNLNPPLEFSDLPKGTKSMVLMVEDVDAPANPWVHWLVFNIPATTLRCPENAIPEGATEGLANGGTFGYEGPCPKYFNGTHRYFFRLYALDTLLTLPQEADRQTVLKAIQGRILAEAQLIGLAEGTLELIKQDEEDNMNQPNDDKKNRRSEESKDPHGVKPGSPARDATEQAIDDFVDTQTRSDALASETRPNSEEAQDRGIVDNMNIDPIADLEETDEVSGPPGPSIPHKQPEPEGQE